MHSRCLSTIAVRSAAASSRRSYTDAGYASSVLGTSTITGQFLAQIKEDAEAGAMSYGETLASCVIRKGEMDHLESPDADARYFDKIDRQAAGLFSRVKAPENPMKVALAPTPDEVRENVQLELLKESVRERYHAMRMQKANENRRIDAVMSSIEDGTYKMPQRIPATWDGDENGHRPLSKTSQPPQPDAEKEKLQLQVEDLKRQLAEAIAAAQASVAVAAPIPAGAATPPTAGGQETSAPVGDSEVAATIPISGATAATTTTATTQSNAL